MDGEQMSGKFSNLTINFLNINKVSSSLFKFFFLNKKREKGALHYLKFAIVRAFDVLLVP
jgi:hypothetical protein